MPVAYSDPVKNADINRSKVALVEIIDELRTRFARKNDAWSEAEALAARRLELLKRTKRYLYHRDECAVNYSNQVCDCRLSKLILELVEELGDDWLETPLP